MREGEARKARTEKLLRERGIPILPSLPEVESEAEAAIRAPAAVARRTLALLGVAMRADGIIEGHPQKDVDTKIAGLIDRLGARDELTADERAFLAERSPSRQRLAQVIWRYECVWTLLWALGKVDALGLPDTPYNAGKVVQRVLTPQVSSFVATAALRPASEILDEADLIYRVHWAVRNAGGSAPAGLDADTTMERHHALNWLVGYMDQDWDDVSTDT